MMFKKDLSKLAYIAGEGKGKLVTIKYTDQEVDRELTLFMNGLLGISIEIFNTDLTLKILNVIDMKYKADRLEEGKIDEVMYGDEFYSNTIKETISEGIRYSYEDFTRYQDNNICPEKETIGLPIGFISKMQNLFEKEIQFIFKGDYIVGVTAYTATPLFIVGGYKMPKQLNLLTGAE